MKITGTFPNIRLRRVRKSAWIRRLVSENNLSADDLILPIFLVDGKNKKIQIKTMPDVYRFTVDKLTSIVDEAINNKIPMIALFPYTNPKLKDNTFVKISQNSECSNTWRKRGYSDGEIDWRMSSEGIYNLVRALSDPYVGAHFLFNEKEIKLWECSIVKENNPNIEPGKFLYYGKHGPVIKAGIDAIEIIKSEPKIKLDIGDYL